MVKRLGHFGVASVFASVCFVWVAVTTPASADRFTSPSYTIDASTVGNSVGGLQTSTNYSLTSAGGESNIGNGAGGSYKLGQGYVAQLENSIQMSVTPSPLNLGSVTPGSPVSGTLTASIQTDTPGYNLSVLQDHDLQSGATTIPAVSGSIASPVTWSDGTTKGLGFTLVSTNATAIPGKWSSGDAYAAFPGTDTTFYNRTGYTAGQTDTLTIRVKLDVALTQAALSYTNAATWTGTTTP